MYLRRRTDGLTKLAESITAMQIKNGKSNKSKAPRPKWYITVCTNRLFILVVAWIGVISMYCSMPPVPTVPGAPSHPLEKYESNFELHARAFRFPSVNERVKMYMSNWYLPPCRVSDGIHFKVTDGADELAQADDAMLRIREVPVVGGEHQRTFRVDSKTIVGGFPFMLQRDNLAQCEGPVSIYEFCNDTMKSVLPALDRVLDGGADDLPLIMQFGDAETTEAHVLDPPKADKMYPQIPFFRKFRHAMSKTDLAALTRGTCQSGKRKIASNRRGVHRLQPIVWLLTEHRHFGPIAETRLLDTPWEEKREKAIWRGALTGVKGGGAYSNQELEAMTDHDRCQAIARCRLVYNNAHSSLVDANLVGNNIRMRGWLPETGEIDGIQLFAEESPYDFQMKYKAIIMIEGNDISSGFKWALMSSSVVMVPPFVYSSWAMEELLIPWVHFVPLKEDLSDVEEQIQWVLNNDAKAKEIGRRGQLWMMDLMYHPNAEADNLAIFEEMMRRYRAHFVHAPDV